MLRMSQRSEQEDLQRQDCLDAAWRYFWLSGCERTLEVGWIGSRRDRATEGHFETRTLTERFRRPMAKQAVSRHSHLSREGDARTRWKQRRRAELLELSQDARSDRPGHAADDLRPMSQRFTRSARRSASHRVGQAELHFMSRAAHAGQAALESWVVGEQLMERTHPACVRRHICPHQ